MRVKRGFGELLLEVTQECIKWINRDCIHPGGSVLTFSPAENAMWISLFLCVSAFIVAARKMHTYTQRILSSSGSVVLPGLCVPEQGLPLCEECVSDTLAHTGCCIDTHILPVRPSRHTQVSIGMQARVKGSLILFLHQVGFYTSIYHG